MPKIFARLQVSLLTLSLVGVAVSGCRTTGGLEQDAEKWTRAQAELLRQAGQRLGVPVQTQNMVQFNQAGATLITAPADNLETIPATQLPRGVNVAVAYVDAPGQSFPRGVYALRTFADVRQVGTVQGRMELVDASGRVAAEVPATIIVESMTVPPDIGRRRTQVSVGSTRLAGRCDPGHETCYCCPNGWIVCTQSLGRALTNVR